MVHAHAGVGVLLSNQEGRVVRCVIWVLWFLRGFKERQ